MPRNAALSFYPDRRFAFLANPSLAVDYDAENVKCPRGDEIYLALLPTAWVANPLYTGVALRIRFTRFSWAAAAVQRTLSP